MKRSGFARPAPKPVKTIEYQPRPRAVAVARADAPARISVPVPKADMVRSEDYRRLVAALPCINCKARGRSQCAHANSPASGKGLALKADDRETFPLCIECHAKFDQGAMFSKDQRREIEPLWTNQTRAILRKLADFDREARRVVERVIGL